jgi:methylaspartate mutase epsilon subunit
MRENYSLLIGSVGDDSHSIGMAFLTIAFREAGLRVKNLGILNVLDDFFYQADDFDAVFISCMNGHADLYLPDFPQKLNMYKQTHHRPKVWYLGGNLSVKEKNETIIRKYLQMGFDMVAPKPITWNEIIANLLRDFDKKGIKKRKILKWQPDEYPEISDLDLVDDNPLSDQEFSQIRQEVLSSWSTGSQVWDTDIPKNHQAPNKNMNHLIRERLKNYTAPIIQPRTGVAHTSDEIIILKYLREKGLEISSIQLDAASRKNMYKQAEEGVRRTEKGKTSFLNGYPVPVHGVKGIETILNSIDTPFQIRAGSPDHRLVYEIGLAGGTSSVEGGFICYLFPYDKRTSPVINLANWKYVDKLAGWYFKNFNIIINREYFGPLTTTLIEPSIAISINIVQAVLSAKSGVKCISVGLAEQGNRSQDIAAIRVLHKTTVKYLKKYGFNDCTVSTVFHQYMGAFPTDELKARDLIYNSSITAALAKATRIMTKTPVESIHIPFKEDNGHGLELTRLGFMKAADQRRDNPAIHLEMQMLEKEVKGIMDYIEKGGQGSLARGTIKAFQAGILDIPFSPSTYNRNLLVAVRDCNGAIRFVNIDQMPFPDEVKEFHQHKVHQRMVKESNTKIFEILEKDLTRIWKNDFVTWPLDYTYVN